MAHGFIDKGLNTSFVSKREIPWHTLGKVVDSMTSEEAIKLAGLDFNVRKGRAFCEMDTIPKEDTGKYPKIVRELMNVPNEGIKPRFRRMEKLPDKYITFREDTGDTFGIVGSKYEIVQNTEVFDFFDSIVGEKLAIYETAGALGNGEKVFVSAKLPTFLDIANDQIDQYLLFSTSHDGSGSIVVMFTPIRVVCNNTLTAALKSSSNVVRFKHTKNVRDKLDYAKQVLGLVKNSSNSLEEAFKHLHKQVIYDDDFDKFVMDTFGYKPNSLNVYSDQALKRLESVTEYYNTGFGQAEFVGTKYGAYNAITGYLQNVETYKTDEMFFDKQLYGAGARIRQNAMDILLV